GVVSATTPSGSVKRTGRVYRPGSTAPVGGSTVAVTVVRASSACRGPATRAVGLLMVASTIPGTCGGTKSMAMVRVSITARVVTATMTVAGSNSTSATGAPCASSATGAAAPPPMAGAATMTRCTLSSTWLLPVTVTAGGWGAAVTVVSAGSAPVSATCTGTERVTTL